MPVRPNPDLLPKPPGPFKHSVFGRKVRNNYNVGKTLKKKGLLERLHGRLRNRLHERLHARLHERLNKRLHERLRARLHE